MALRLLIYCARTYEAILDNSAMYVESRVTIPKPKFYVLYNGIKPFPEKEIYRLSDSFIQPAKKEESPLELIVDIYNINKGYNDDIITRSQNLFGYVEFVNKAREFEKDGMERIKAVKAAIRQCINQGILKEYLSKYVSEVLNMVFQEWNWDDAKAVWQKEAAELSDRKWQSVIADKDSTIADKDAALADKDAENEILHNKLAELQAKIEEQ